MTVVNTCLNTIHGRNIANKISPVNNIASKISQGKISPVNNIVVGGVVTRARLMQSRAWAARVSGARGARCAPLTAPVGARVDRSPSATPRRPLRSLYIGEPAARARALKAVITRGFSLALCLSFETCFVSAGVLLSSLPALPLCVSSRRLSRSALVSAIDSTPVCLISASATPLARRVPFYSYIANKYINFICNSLCMNTIIS